MANPSQPRPPLTGFRKFAVIFFISVFVVLCGGGMIIFAVAASTGGSSQPQDPAEGVTYACEQFVKDALKAPSTADFSNEAVHGPVGGNPNRFVVVGAVDAENSFGAKIRSNFGCTAEKRSDGNWHLVDMTGLT